MGDFNDTPDSTPLKPLLGNGSNLKDIFDNPKFKGDGRPGTFGNGHEVAEDRLHPAMPALFGRVESATVFRRGMWGGKNGDLFEHFPEMTKAIHAASDHAALVVDLDL